MTIESRSAKITYVLVPYMQEPLEENEDFENPADQFSRSYTFENLESAKEVGSFLLKSGACEYCVVYCLIWKLSEATSIDSWEVCVSEPVVYMKTVYESTEGGER